VELMQTEQLIADLARDLAAPPRGVRPLGIRLLVATLIAALTILLVIAFGLSVNPDLAHGLNPAIPFTLAAALVLAAGAFWTATTLGRPDANAHARWLLLPALILALGVGAELVTWPPATWTERLMGSEPLICFALVSLLSLPILGAALFALRSGAPTRPGLSGAMAGLMAGGTTAALYTLHCPEDSLLFVVAWHVPAVALVAAIGALLAGKLLRW
jgi:hypothetical protein